MNLALSITDLGRFRVNIFKELGEVAMVIRNIKMEIPSMASSSDESSSLSLEQNPSWEEPS